MLAALNAGEAGFLLWVQNALRAPLLDPVILFFTKLGNTGALFILLTALLLVFPRTRRVGLAAALGLLCSLLFTNLILKNLFQRVRPWEAFDFLRNLVVETDTSFPSGHTSAAFAFALAVVRAGPKTWRKSKAAVVVLAVLMGLSRLYVGAHYPTDVLAGALVGSLAGVTGWYLSTRLLHRFPRLAPTDTHTE